MSEIDAAAKAAVDGDIASLRKDAEEAARVRALEAHAAQVELAATKVLDVLKDRCARWGLDPNDVWAKAAEKR